MASPEQLLADRDWRRRNSRYAIWAAVPAFGFISLLYTGLKAKKAEWVLAGTAYGAVYVSVLFVSNLFDDGSIGSAAVGWVAFTLWVTSGIHVLLKRRAWLRWRAEGVAAGSSDVPAADAQPPPPPLGPSAEALAEIDRIDPLSAYVDPVAVAASPPMPTLDLNTATAEQLAAVLGAGAIGEVLAHRIVEERTRVGRFGSIDQAASAVQLEPQLHARLSHAVFVPPGGHAVR